MDGTANSTGCPIHGGPGDVAGDQGRRRLAQRPRAGLQVASTGTADPIAADWHNGKSAMIGKLLQRHAAQRRRRDGRRGPDDDRPDQRDLRPGTTTRAWAASSAPPTTRRSCRNYVTDAATAPAYCAPVARHAERRRRRRRRRRHERVLGRPQLPPRTSARSRRRCSRRTASRTTTSSPTSSPSGGTGLAANNVPRKLWLCREGHVDPFMTPPRRVDEPAAPVVRLLALRRPERRS